VAPPEPSFAERARTLSASGRNGMLATLAVRPPGHPFGSLAPYGLDANGQPTLLLSTLAMHTQHLMGDPRASLLIADAASGDEPLAGARATLLGAVAPVPDGERGAVRAEYLERHPAARAWVDFDDFGFYRLEVVECYLVAGFGAMGWVSAADYRAAAPDPLAQVAAGILSHMNADHADALVLYCRAFGDVPADAATMTAVDRLGFRVRARIGEQLHGLRITFPREVRSATEARAVLVEMVRDARARLSR
jgi:putative heme iron utilization protein